jgi:hypothetical protein
MTRNVKNPAAPIRGVVVEVPAGAPQGTGYAILHRGRGGEFKVSFRSPTGRLLGGVLGDPGRPANLWPEHRSRTQGDPVAAIARAKMIAARRAQPQVEQVEDAWQPPAVLPTPRLPRTPEGTARTLRKLARRRRRFEMIQMANPEVEMPLVVPGPPVSVEVGQRILEERYRLAALRARHPDASEEALELM